MNTGHEIQKCQSKYENQKMLNRKICGQQYSAVQKPMW